MEEKEKKLSRIEEWNSRASQEEHSASARKGGQTSAQNRRKYKAMRDILKEILVLDVTDADKKEALQKLGLDPSFANLGMLSAVQKMADGDIEASRFVRDSVGEKPTETYNVGVSNKTIEQLDLSTLTDAELEELATKEATKTSEPND